MLRTNEVCFSRTERDEYQCQLLDWEQQKSPLEGNQLEKLRLIRQKVQLTEEDLEAVVSCDLL